MFKKQSSTENQNTQFMFSNFRRPPLPPRIVQFIR